MAKTKIEDFKAGERFLFHTAKEPQVREGVLCEMAGNYVNCGYGQWHRADQVIVLAELPELPKPADVLPPASDELLKRVSALEQAAEASAPKKLATRVESIEKTLETVAEFPARIIALEQRFANPAQPEGN